MTNTIVANTSSRGGSRDLLRPLTSFRFIAALLVFVWHTHLWQRVSDPLELGYVGVSFFYVLSGFILTFAYFQKVSSGNTGYIKSFYFARIAKLFPVHILMFIAALPLALPVFHQLYAHATSHVIKQAVINLTLLQSYFPTNEINFSFNGVAWSISDELFFYALFPIVVILLAKYRKYLSVPVMLGIMAVLWLALVCWLAPHHAVIDQWAYYIFPPIRLPDFVFGMFIGLIYLHQIHHHTKPSWGARRGSVMEALALVILSAAVILSAHLHQSVRFGAFLMPFWGTVIYVFSWQSGILSRLLSVRPLVYLGEMSFSFYMCHQLIIRYVANYPTSHRALVSFIGALVVSYCMYNLYEEPSRKRLRNLLERTFGSHDGPNGSTGSFVKEENDPRLRVAVSDPQ